MTQSSVAPKIHESLDINRKFPPQIAFDHKFADLLPKPVHLFIAERLHLDGGLNAGAPANLRRPCTSNAVNGGEGNYYVLLLRNVNAGNSCHLDFSSFSSYAS